jgi:uncharacterized iron-regulated membrane protein
MRLSRTFARRARKTFFFIHLWTGLLLGLWFTAVGLTGSGLAFMDELTALEVRTRLGIEGSAAGARLIPPSQALAAVKSAHPELSRRSTASMLVPTGRFPFYIFWKLPERRSGGDTMMYVVDPYSAKAYPPLNYTRFWIAWVKSLHMDLLAGATGLIANGVLSFFALFMLLSGIWLWWPATVNQLRMRLTLKRGQSIRRTLYDLHNMMGIYLFGLLFITTLTAVIWVADSATEGGVVKAIDKQKPKREAPPEVTPQGTVLNVDLLVEKVGLALPEARINFISLPQKPNQPFVAQFFRSSNGLLSEGQIALDPYSGNVFKIVRESEKSTGQKTMTVVEDLHRGVYAGIWSKILYLLTGLMPLGLFITGLWMWFNKKRSEWKRRSKRGPAVSPSDKTTEVQS